MNRTAIRVPALYRQDTRADIEARIEIAVIAAHNKSLAHLAGAGRVGERERIGIVGIETMPRHRFTPFDSVDWRRHQTKIIMVLWLPL